MILTLVMTTSLQEMVSDSRGKQDNQLELWADAPRWEYSTAPLMDWDSGEALPPANPGSRGHSLLLNDQQVHLLWGLHYARHMRKLCIPPCQFGLQSVGGKEVFMMSSLDRALYRGVIAQP